MDKDLEIWWIRHGQSTWNIENRWQGHSNIPLSEIGQQQALRLRRALQEVVFDSIYSSDLDRAQHTARLALPEGSRIISDARLRECHFGDFEGLTRAQMDEAQTQVLGQWLQDPFGLPIPGGESLADVQQRVQSWLSELPGSGRVAVFTHGGVIRSSLWSTQPDTGNNPWRVQIANCSTTCIRYSNPIKIEWVNDTSFLD